MFRSSVRARPQLASRVLRRGAHTEYGPEQALLTKGRIITAVVTTGFIGAVWYDKFYSKGSKEGKSAIGDRIIPSTPTREQVFAHEDMMTAKALKRREEMQILFSADNTRTNLEENIRTVPVPEPIGRSLRPGQTLDLNEIDERRPRTVYFKKIDDSASE